MQFDLAFDPAVLEVTGVNEGMLLKQGGACTYFTRGSTDNVAGTLKGVAGAITTAGADVGDEAVFAVVSFLAKAEGVSALTLSDMIVGDISGCPVSLAVSGAIVTAVSYSVTGHIAYGGGQTGSLHVGVYKDAALTSPEVGPVTAEPGADVTLEGLGQATNYYFGAFIDSDENGRMDASEAFGATQFDIVSEDVTGLNVILADPDLDADNLPDYWEALYAGYSGGSGIGTSDDDADRDGYSNGREFTNGTDPTVPDEAGGEGYDSLTDQRVAPEGWSVVRSHGYYRPGKIFEVTLTVQYSGNVTALGIVETMPGGWTFQAAESAGGMNVSGAGEGGVEFSWVSLPEDGEGQAVNPFGFTYTLEAPEDAYGSVTFSGIVFMRIDDGVERVFLVEDTVAERFAFHSADYDPADWSISISELLRLIQLFNMDAYHCDPMGEDGFNPGLGDYIDGPHSADYNPCDGIIGLSELLRVIQFYNVGGYYEDAGGEDGFQAGER